MSDTTPAIPRSSGLLLHVTSLPGPYGIGDLGPAARRWVDRLASANQRWWQILPLGPPGAGDSPYQCYSAFAGDPDLVSPDLLRAEGLLTRRDLAGARFPDDHVDFLHVRPFKSRLMSLAWERFRAGTAHPLRTPFDTFRHDNAAWLDDYALFMSLRRAHPGRSWTDWPRDLVLRKPAALAAARRELADEVAREQFAQYCFFRQLTDLRRYAHAKQVRLIGDLPIFVSPESADVWANPHLFRLYRHRRPTHVAGVPPDYFSVTGQRWGNPLYDWRAMARDDFAWWVDRFRATLRQVDLLRVDHFRGFAASWSIPAHLPTAVRGRWVKVPGRAMFDRVRDALGGLPFIAEDLGLITPDVAALRTGLGLPGMRVLQFAFDGSPTNPFLPHNYDRNTVVYTGTHDNDTTVGWYRSLSAKEKRVVRRYLSDVDRDVAGELIRCAWSSIADLAVAPVQDVLRLGTRARMNLPGTAIGNWGWRLKAADLKRPEFAALGELTRRYARSG